MTSATDAPNLLEFSPIPTDGRMKFRATDDWDYDENALMWTSRDLARWACLLLTWGDVDRATVAALAAIDMDAAFVARRRGEYAADQAHKAEAA